MNGIGVAIIGCGYWGINYVRVFSELPQSRVVVVCDQRAERLEAVRSRFPGVPVTTEVQEALEWTGVRAAVVSTPATTHYDIARTALAAGKPLLIEKPITTKASQAKELADLSLSSGIPLMVGHTFIYNTGIRKLKDYLEQGRLGQIYYLYARRTNMGPVRRDVNVLWDLASHDVSIFNFLLGASPEWVSAVGSQVLGNGREDVGFVSLGYSDGVIAHIHVSWADPNKVREVVLVGSEMRVVFDDVNTLERVRVFEKGIKLAPSEASSEASSYGEEFMVRDGDIVSPRIEASEPLKNQCGHFLECVAEGRQPFTGGAEALEVVRVMEAADRSLQDHGAPVRLTDL